MSSIWMQREIQWTVHWFKKWTVLQREEFLKELVDKSLPQLPQALDIAMRRLNMEEDPDVFHCQLRLFSEWFEGWSDIEKNGLVEKLKLVDPSFVERLSSILSSIACCR
ncbi:uncharacterized protein C14orf119-like [Haliotis cracherodii]|uniref:uncharacterized protein C14orf119-like n=1 Tax=Haliotis cracherodii TaxID=6455 RepID=UPI0039E96374